MSYQEWPHPERCPGPACRGQFFWLKHYGMICTIKLLQLTDGSIARVWALSEQCREEQSEGLGLA